MNRTCNKQSMPFIALPVKAGLSLYPSNEWSYTGLSGSSKVGSQFCFDYVKGCNAKGGTQRKNMLKNNKNCNIHEAYQPVNLEV